MKDEMQCLMCCKWFDAVDLDDEFDFCPKCAASYRKGHDMVKTYVEVRS